MGFFSKCVVYTTVLYTFLYHYSHYDSYRLHARQCNGEENRKNNIPLLNYVDDSVNNANNRNENVEGDLVQPQNCAQRDVSINFNSGGDIGGSGSGKQFINIEERLSKLQAAQMQWQAKFKEDISDAVDRT